MLTTTMSTNHLRIVLVKSNILLISRICSLLSLPIDCSFVMVRSPWCCSVRGTCKRQSNT